MKKLFVLTFLLLFPLTSRAYAVIPNDQSRYVPAVQSALQGLPSIPYTILLEGGEVLCAGRYSAGCTNLGDHVITLDTDVASGQLDYVLWREYYHASSGTPSEPNATLFATNLARARGTDVVPWGVTPEEQAWEDAWNDNH